MLIRGSLAVLSFQNRKLAKIECLSLLAVRTVLIRQVLKSYLHYVTILAAKKRATILISHYFSSFLPSFFTPSLPFSFLIYFVILKKILKKEKKHSFMTLNIPEAFFLTWVP